VHHRRLQTSRWLYHDDQLWVFDATGSVRVEAVPWRVGAIRPHPGHRTVLELIRRARVPCVNPAAVLLRGYDRLSMLNELREAGLPVPTMTIALGEERLDRFEPPLPAVVKVGNYHGGYGKARPRDAEEWANVKDLSFATEEYVTVEPYIAYTRDIRCLAVGEQLWAMARRGRFWKANTATEHYEMIQVRTSCARTRRGRWSTWARICWALTSWRRRTGRTSCWRAMTRRDWPAFLRRHGGRLQQWCGVRSRPDALTGREAHHPGTCHGDGNPT